MAFNGDCPRSFDVHESSICEHIHLYLIKLKTNRNLWISFSRSKSDLFARKRYTSRYYKFYCIQKRMTLEHCLCFPLPFSFDVSVICAVVSTIDCLIKCFVIRRLIFISLPLASKVYQRYAFVMHRKYWKMNFTSFKITIHPVGICSMLLHDGLHSGWTWYRCCSVLLLPTAFYCWPIVSRNE